MPFMFKLPGVSMSIGMIIAIAAQATGRIISGPRKCVLRSRQMVLLEPLGIDTRLPAGLVHRSAGLACHSLGRTQYPPTGVRATCLAIGSTKPCSSSSRLANGLPSIAICSSRVRAESASRGYPARSPRRHATTAIRCSTRVCRGCLPISNWPMVMVASPASFAPWSRPIC
jgi:hypothetical protein